jgi:hypothetical protein
VFSHSGFITDMFGDGRQAGFGGHEKKRPTLSKIAEFRSHFGFPPQGGY